MPQTGAIDRHAADSSSAGAYWFAGPLIAHGHEVSFLAPTIVFLARASILRCTARWHLLQPGWRLLHAFSRGHPLGGRLLIIVDVARQVFAQMFELPNRS